MQPDLTPLDAYLGEESLDGYLIDAGGDDSDQRYLAGFGAPDPFVSLYAAGEVHLLVNALEYGRARKESNAATVGRFSDYDFRERAEESGREAAKFDVLAEFLSDHGVESVAVPFRFPTGTADALRERDVTVIAESNGTITDIRATKTDEEIEHVRTAQRANEAAMRAAEEMLAEATVEAGVLHHEGEPLTSERVQEEIEVTLLRHGCSLDETIVACGEQAADPHDRGSGPLETDQPIIVDIFPRDKATKYHADMTRTFVRGDPADTVQEWYDLTADAQQAAFDAIEPGVAGSEVHDAVCDVYEAAGYPTLRSNDGTETGYIHGTGHGVGLDVHEQPSLSLSADDELEPGHVVTVEPGLYDPSVGGVRIEDIVVVTEDGFENLTDYPRRLVLD